MQLPMTGPKPSPSPPTETPSTPGDVLHWLLTHPWGATLVCLAVVSLVVILLLNSYDTRPGGGKIR